MTTITLFEHQRRSYAELGLSAQDPTVAGIAALNEAAGAEIIGLGHRGLWATQYVGVIRVGHLTVQILPKIDYDPGGDAEAVADTRPHHTAIDSATRNLLTLLSYAQDVRLRVKDVAGLLTRRADWFEILTHLLALNLHRLMKRGVERAYVNIEEMSPVLRGRWQIARQLTRRPHVRHRFDVAYDQFSPDTPLNRVFAFVVERLLHRAQDPETIRLLRDVNAWLDEVDRPGMISSATLDEIHFTRLNERFRPAFNLARLFIENETFQLSKGPREMYAFAFDMNRLFERFVYCFIARHRRRILPPEWSSVRVVEQARGETVYLAQRMPGGERVLRLRPDVLFMQSGHGKPLLVLDMKYKRLKSEHLRLGIAEADVYQMLAYATRLDCPSTLLLYPHAAGAPGAPVTFETMGHRSRLTAATVDLRQPLDPPDHLIHSLSETLREVAHNGTLT